jgi:hypothetical protein
MGIMTEKTVLEAFKKVFMMISFISVLFFGFTTHFSRFPNAFTRNSQLFWEFFFEAGGTLKQRVYSHFWCVQMKLSESNNVGWGHDLLVFWVLPLRTLKLLVLVSRFLFFKRIVHRLSLVMNLGYLIRKRSVHTFSAASQMRKIFKVP